MSKSKPSVYTRLGGRAPVERAVQIFYDRVSADARINKFFKAADMRRLRLKLAQFIVYAFGGPEEYAGRNLVEVHKPVIRKGATEYHFDIVAAHFIGTLADMGVAKETRDEVFTVLVTVKPLFPNPWWRKLYYRIFTKRKEKLSQEIDRIAKRQAHLPETTFVEITAKAGQPPQQTSDSGGVGQPPQQIGDSGGVGM